LTYQLSRFVARNRGGVSIVATLVVALLGFAGYALYEQSRRLAESRRAQEIAKFLTAMLESSATAQTGNPNLTVLQMVERADARIERGLAPPADVAARLQSAFAYVMREAGRDQQALQIADRALRRADQSRQPLAQLVTRQSRAEILMRFGRCADALASFREADALLPTARQELEPGALAAYLLARANADSRCESRPADALRRLGEAAAIEGLQPVTQAAVANAEALEFSRLGRNAEALAAIERGLAAARSHPDGGYFQVALLRMRSQVERLAGNLESARQSMAEAVKLSPGKVNIFEELRLPLLEAGILADLKQFEEARSLAANSLSRASEAGAAAWMLHADAAEVYAKCGECALAIRTYETVDQLTGGKIPNDWRGNRLFFTAECLATADPTRAAALAREALTVYGALLPEASPRRQRLLVLSSAK
jgi:tetratricopeptide (TPR) repeat protein